MLQWNTQAHWGFVLFLCQGWWSPAAQACLCFGVLSTLSAIGVVPCQLQIERRKTRSCLLQAVCRANPDLKLRSCTQNSCDVAWLWLGTHTIRSMLLNVGFDKWMRKQVTTQKGLRSTHSYLWLGNLLDPTPTKKAGDFYEVQNAPEQDYPLLGLVTFKVVWHSGEGPMANRADISLGYPSSAYPSTSFPLKVEKLYFWGQFSAGLVPCTFLLHYCRSAGCRENKGSERLTRVKGESIQW